MWMVSIFNGWPLPALTPLIAPLQAITYFQRVLHVKGPILQGQIGFQVDITNADGL